MNRQVLPFVTAAAMVWAMTAAAGAQSASQPSPATQTSQPQAGRTQPAGPLPRYQLEAGQELAYESTALMATGETGRPNMKREIQRNFAVTRRNADGSWRLVMLESSRTTRMLGNKSAGQPRTGKELIEFNLYPDGRMEGKALASPQLNLRTIFPMLPGGENAQAAWSSPESPRGAWRYKAAPASQPTERNFTAREESPTNTVYQVDQEVTYTFDTAKGLISRAELRMSQAYGGKSSATETTQLANVQMHDKAWTEDFDRQADILFPAVNEYDRAFRDIRPGDADVQGRLNRAAEALRAATSKLTNEALADPAKARLSSHADSVSGMLEQLKQLSAIVSAPAPTWTAADFDGKAHSLEGYRGKVVVMDFWFRGCGWCLLTMPQIKQLAEDFAGKPVVILGMNTDSQDSDARMVIETLGLNYPNLRAKDLASRYKVQVFPTMFIVDKQGIVRDVRMGFESELRSSVGKVIESLLAEPASGTTQPSAGK